MKRILRLVFMLVTDYIYLISYSLGNKLITDKHYTISLISNNKRLPEYVKVRLLTHKVQVLGDSYLDFSQPKLIWNRCPSTGYKWTNRWHRFVNKERPTITDIKIPWEISRLQHLTTLMMYANDSDTKAFVYNTVVDFHTSNRIGFGVNWACTMDVSIRATNLVFIYLLTDHKPTKEYILAQVPHYYHFICKYDEWNEGERNNHYLTNLMAKIILSQLMEKITGKNDIKEKVVKHLFELEMEVGYQYTNEGVNFEGSINYHRLSTEILIITYAFLKEFNFDSYLKDNFLSKINKMCMYMRALYNQCGHTQIGDTDSGFVVNLSPNYRSLNGAVVQDFAKVNSNLFYLELDKINNISDLLYCMYASYSPLVEKDNTVKCKKIKFNGAWRLPISSPNYEIVLNDYDSGIIKLTFDKGYLLIKRLGKFNTGHSHLDYLKTEVFIDGVFYSLFKGTEKYSKPLASRFYDRVGFYNDKLKGEIACFSPLPLPLAVLSEDKLTLNSDILRIELGEVFIEVKKIGNDLILLSNTNPFLYPLKFYPSYNSPREVIYE